MSLLISKAGQKCPRRCPVFSRTAEGLEKNTDEQDPSVCI